MIKLLVVICALIACSVVSGDDPAPDTEQFALGNKVAEIDDGGVPIPVEDNSVETGRVDNAEPPAGNDDNEDPTPNDGR